VRKLFVEEVRAQLRRELAVALVASHHVDSLGAEGQGNGNGIERD
jgi:hypothetical protein